MRRALFLTFLLVIATSACGGSIAEPAKGGGKAAMEPHGEAPSNDELKQYFEYLAADDPAEMRKAVKLSAPKSNAAAYATYMAANAQAERDAGNSLPEETVKSIDNGFALCDAREAEDGCSKYTKITYSRGKIAEFNAGGKPLAKRITLGNGESKALGNIAEAKMIAAYNSIAGDLVVVFEIKALQDEFYPSGATLVSPEGRQSENTEETGPSTLRKDALSNYSFVFKGADIGGTITISGFANGSSSTYASATFTTR